MKNFISSSITLLLIIVQSCSDVGSTTTIPSTLTNKQEIVDLNNHTESQLEMESSTENYEMSFGEVEKSLGNVVKNVLNRMIPYMMRTGRGSTASTLCMINLGRMFFAMPKLQEWAFKMLDASGKISGGLLEGTSMALGDYDECLDVVIGGGPRTPDSDTGSYCLVESRPSAGILSALKGYQVEKSNRSVLPLARTKTFLGFLRKVKSNPDHVSFRFGLCVPSTCSKSDVQNLIDIAIKDVPIPVKVVRCESDTSFEIETHQLVIMIIVFTFIVLAIVGSIVDCFLNNETDSHVVKYKNYLDKTNSNSKEKKILSLSSKLSQAVLLFSLRRNTIRLLNCASENDALRLMRGIKVITVIMAIYTHTYALAHPIHMFRYRNAMNFFKFIDKIFFGAVANSSVGVETFFFITGFLVIYNRWRLAKRPLVISYISKFIAVHYVRIALMEFLVIGLFFLFPLLGSGPLWHEFIDGPLENCQKKWWMNLLFIQNFSGPYDSCLYHTWILAAIMQIMIVTATVVCIMSRWPVMGIVANIVIIAVSMVAVAVVTGVAGYPATFAVYFYDYRTSINVWKYLYVQAYNHIGPFCIGMMTAFFTAEHTGPKIRKPVVIFCWLSTIVTCSLIVFGLYSYRGDKVMDRSLAVFYATMHRPAWALALGWIVYSCATGYGGIVNSVLSWRAFAPLERLCSLAYLIHILLMYYHGAVQRDVLFMGHYNQIMNFASYATVSFVLSALGYLLFQAPYENLEEIICGGKLWKVWPHSDSEVTLNDKISTIPEAAFPGSVDPITKKQQAKEAYYAASNETFIEVEEAAEATKTHM